MMPMIRELARCNQALFYGWRIGTVRIDIAGPASHFVSKMTPVRHSCRSIIIQGINENGCMCQYMQCVVCQPKAASPKAHPSISDLPAGQARMVLHVFSIEEIQQYCIQSGDNNPIHQGEHPIVPGLYIAWYIQRTLAVSLLHWKVSFHAPVYADDTVTVVQGAGRWCGYVQTHQVFTIQLLRT